MTENLYTFSFRLTVSWRKRIQEGSELCDVTGLREKERVSGLYDVNLVIPLHSFLISGVSCNSFLTRLRTGMI